MTQEKKKEIKMEDIRTKADEKNCPVQKSLVFIEEFLAGPMCGRCLPCSLGSYEARIRIKRFTEGTATEEEITILKRIASNMLGASMCKRGKDTARFIIENMESVNYEEHSLGICSYKECTDIIKYIIIPEHCTMCGVCQDVCKYNAIIGEKRKPYLSGYLPFEIAQKRCTRCGECIKVCPYGAIELVSEIGEKEAVTSKS